AHGHRRPGGGAGAVAVSYGAQHLHHAALLRRPRQPPAPPRPRLRAGDRPAARGVALGDKALRSVSICYHQRRRAPCQRRARGDHPGEASPPGPHARPGQQHSERLPGQGFLIKHRRRPKARLKESIPMDDRADSKVDSKFRFVLVAAPRDEQLMRGDPHKVEAGKRKPTRVAMQEVDSNLVDWDYGPAPQPEPEAAGETEEAAEAGPGAPL